LPTSFLAHKLMESFHQLHKLNRNQFAITGLKSSEVFVLFHIKKAVQHLGPGIKLKDISKHLMVTAPSVTPIIKSLENQGLIERTTDEKDKRSIRIRLTDKGASKINQTWDDFTNKYNELVIYLGEDKTKKLIEIQSEILTYLNNKQEN